MSNQLKAFHDLLLQMKPDGAPHCEESCALCASEADPETTNREEWRMSTFTQEQVDALLEDAKAKAEAAESRTAELQARVDELETQFKESEVGAAVAEAVAAKDAEIADLAAKLDAETARAATAESTFEAFKTELAELEAERVRAAELEARKVQRTEEVKALEVFSDEKIAENIDRWSALDEDEFKARLSEWADIKASKQDESQDPPTASAISAARTESAAGSPAIKGLAALVSSGQIRNL